MAKSNPNKANQYKPDPRQSLFLQYYLDPKSKTFSNALQSALKAGFEQEYAENITGQMPTWLSENLGKNNRLEKAEKVFDDTLGYSVETEQGIDTNLLRIKSDVAKFIASTIGKDKGYSTRQEVTGKDGDAIKHEVDITKQLEKTYGDDSA